MADGGWAKPPRARAAHYYEGSGWHVYSMCGKWPRSGKLCARQEIGCETPLCQLCEHRAPRDAG